MRKKKIYVAPCMEAIDMEEDSAILGLSNGDDSLRAVFDDDYVDDEDASEAYSSELNHPFDD